jgi:hypothetical protein
MTKPKPWTFEENEIVRINYPKGGAVLCLKHLRGRSHDAVKFKAKALRVKAPRHIREHRGKWNSTETIDAEVRKVYSGTPTKDAVRDLATRILRPRWWVAKRAAQLGVSVLLYEPRWSKVEIMILEANIHKSIAKIQKALGNAGCHRSIASISSKRIKLELTSRNDPSVYNGNQLAALMGVHSSTVTKKWIRRGMLRAKSQENGFKILEADIREFVINFTAEFDIRRVDKFWFVDMLACPIKKRKPERPDVRFERALPA